MVSLVAFLIPTQTLVCSREVSTACREIVVNLYGGAKEKYPELAGIYKPVEGKMNMGRWVGSYKKKNSFTSEQLSLIQH